MSESLILAQNAQVCIQSTDIILLRLIINVITVQEIVSNPPLSPPMPPLSPVPPPMCSTPTKQPEVTIN